MRNSHSRVFSAEGWVRGVFILRPRYPRRETKTSLSTWRRERKQQQKKKKTTTTKNTKNDVVKAISVSLECRISQLLIQTAPPPPSAHTSWQSKLPRGDTHLAWLGCGVVGVGVWVVGGGEQQGVGWWAQCRRTALTAQARPTCSGV